MRSIRPTTTGLAGLATIALVATACSAGAPAKSPIGADDRATSSAATGSLRPTTSALSPGATPTATAIAASPDAWLAVGRKGQPGLEVIRASTRERMFALPTGVPTNPEWGSLISTELKPGSTIVRDVVVQPGLPGDAAAVDGSWRLPTIGPDPVPVGLALGGPTIVLVENVAPGTNGRTRFAILERGFTTKPRIIELAGRFDYDALSPSGSVLYVVEHLDADAGGRYQVRAVELPSGTLRDGVIVDKRNVDEAMAGYPLAQVRRADGGVLTLYRGKEHPFIHALNSVDGWALCIDLPANGANVDAAAADWGLAQTEDGHAAYAVNATLGLVEEIDPANFAISREARVTPVAGSGIVLAKFGHQESGPTGRRVVVAPDRATVYAAGAGGILAISTADLSVTGRFAPGTAIEALALTPDGGTLYALRKDGHIDKIDAATGTVQATVPGDDYDRLVAVVPW